MRRIIFFAHYDKQNIIDPYVIDYLKELRKYANDIIFSSDGDLSDKEKSKVSDLCTEVISKRHGEYDFGSHKRGFELILDKYPEKLKEADELLLINDSCYLIGSFKKVFHDMSKKTDCDCWGLIDDYSNFDENRKYYIGSFFMAFRKGVFQEKFFHDFLCDIKKLKDHSEIVNKYEFGLSELLMQHKKKLFGYYNFNKVSHYIADNHLEIANDIYEIAEKNSYLKKRTILHKIINDVCNVHVYNHLHTNKYYVLLKMGFPLLKRRNLQYKSFTRKRLMFLWQESLEFLRTEELQTNISKIKSHFKRTNLKLKTKKIIANRFEYFLYLLAISRPFYKKCSISAGKEVVIYKILFFKIKLRKNIAS